MPEGAFICSPIESKEAASDLHLLPQVKTHFFMTVAVLPVCSVAAGLGWALELFRNADVAFLTAVRVNTNVF
jgi:hypothetical protein